MRHLISREDYIKEYLRISNQELLTNNNQIDSENELYEGLLGTLFGGLKMLFKRDWASIKCKNPNVLKHLQAIDKSLAGYTMVKMEFSNECQNIRQNIADYFNDILEYKLLQIEKIENVEKFLEQEEKEIDENNEAKGVEKRLNIKDKSLLESIKKYKENINTNCKVSPKLREYADQMLNSVITFVNDVVISELDKKAEDKAKAKLEEERKKIEAEKKREEEERKKKDEEAKKESEEILKKISAERDKAMRKLGINPIGAMDGNKAVDVIVDQFKGCVEEFKGSKMNESALPQIYSDILKGDTYIGIQKSLEELKWSISDETKQDTDDAVFDKFMLGVILNKINNVFEVVSKSKDKFEGIPSGSVQAMMVSLANAVIYGFKGNEFEIEKNDARISLLSKCAIDSDATIGFNLPLIDNSKPDNGNFFVGIMNHFRNESTSSDEVNDAAKNLSEKDLKIVLSKLNVNADDESSDENDKSEDIEKDQDEFIKKWGSDVMKQFRQNISKLFDIMVEKANKLKESAKKKREKESAKAQQESENKAQQESEANEK